MLTAAYYPLPPLSPEASQFFDVQFDGAQAMAAGWQALVMRKTMQATYTGPPGLMTAAYYPLPPLKPTRHYKDDLFTLPDYFDDGKPISHDVTRDYVNPFKMPEPEHLDHPSWRRPPVEDHAIPRWTPPSSKSSSASASPQTYITPPETPDKVEAVVEVVEIGEETKEEVIENADLVPAEALPAPDALPLEQSGWVLADVVADIILEHFTARFGVIGAPVSEVKTREPTEEAMDARRAQVKRSDFFKLVRVALEMTRLTVEAVAAAVAILIDERLRRELSARPLGLSFIGALAVGNKLTTDFVFSARSWSEVSNYDTADINRAERGILHSLAYETSLNRDDLAHAARKLLEAPSLDHTAHVALVNYLDSIVIIA